MYGLFNLLRSVVFVLFDGHFGSSLLLYGFCEFCYVRLLRFVALVCVRSELSSFVLFSGPLGSSLLLYGFSEFLSVSYSPLSLCSTCFNLFGGRLSSSLDLYGFGQFSLVVCSVLVVLCCSLGPVCV